MEFFNRVANFIDDLLERYYNTERFYCINDLEDLVGQLIIGLAHILVAAYLVELLDGPILQEDMHIRYFMLQKKIVMVMKIVLCC